MVFFVVVVDQVTWRIGEIEIGEESVCGDVLIDMVDSGEDERVIDVEPSNNLLTHDAKNTRNHLM